MPWSAEQIAAARGAERLLSDPVFLGAMDKIRDEAMQLAIIGDDPAVREANRHLVIAVARIKVTLEAAVQDANEAEQEAERIRSFE